MLADTGVAVAPGVDFDTETGGRFVRLSFAGQEREMHEGLERLAGWLVDFGIYRVKGSK